MAIIGEPSTMQEVASEFAPLSSTQLRSELGLPPEPSVEPPADEGDVKWNPDKSRYEASITVGEKTQVFVGKTIGEVATQLVKAQKNASEKIAELTSKKRPVQVDKTIPGFQPTQFREKRALTPTEILAITNAQQDNPEQAFRLIFEAMVGCPPEAVQASIQQAQNLYARRLADEAAYEFLADHPDDYDAEPKHMNKIYGVLKAENLPVTRNNLEYAFQTLSEQGYQFVKPAPVTPEVVEEQPEEVSPPPPPRTVTGNSARVASPGPSGAGGVREASTLPLGQLRDLIQRSNRAMGNGARR